MNYYIKMLIIIITFGVFTSNIIILHYFYKMKLMIVNYEKIIKYCEKKISYYDKMIKIIITRLYNTNKYYNLNIDDNYDMKYMLNFNIICLNTKNIEIKLPPINDKNVIGSIVYIKNQSNYNIKISSDITLLNANLIFNNNSFLLRPKNIVKIIMISKNKYLTINI